MTILEKIQKLVSEGKVKYSYHALEEKLPEINHRHGLNLTQEDIKSVILTGFIAETFRDDDRGTRYAITGFSLDNKIELEIICRIENNVVIITVYERYF